MAPTPLPLDPLALTHTVEADGEPRLDTGHSIGLQAVIQELMGKTTNFF